MGLSNQFGFMEHATVRAYPGDINPFDIKQNV